MALDPAIATLLGAVVGGAVAFSGNLVLFYKDREARRDQRIAESEKWQREQLVTRLSESVRLVNLYITKALPHGDDVKARQNDPDCQKTSAEAQGALVAIVLVYPDKANKDFKDLVQHLDRAMFEGTPPVSPFWDARQLLVKIAAQLAPAGNALPKARGLPPDESQRPPVDNVTSDTH